MRVNARGGNVIHIGRVGENLVTEVVFDISKWFDSSGGTISDLTGELVLYISKDSETYIVNRASGDLVYNLSNNKLVTWIIKNSFLQYPGPGRCEIRYSVNQQVAFSEIYYFVVTKSLDGEVPSTPPEYLKNYLEEIIEQTAEISGDIDLVTEYVEAASVSAATAQAAATSAQQSATSASTSASNAATSASGASTSADQASTSATNAATSASQASTSASTASTAATNASQSATNAANSASSASASASDAADSASSASTSATNAASSASQASTSASNASTSAIDASNSASSAATSASNASTSASNAATSAADAAASADRAQQIVGGDFATHTELSTGLASKENKGAVTTTTLSASGWSNSTYSGLQTTYPAASYDIEVFPNGDIITEAQMEAWSQAKLTGSSTSNVLIAIGTTPTINIPIIVKAISK